jgi:hypothetical protein
MPHAGHGTDRSTPHGRAASAGRMTTAMRATGAPTGPRVLRIAVVLGGRIVEERIVKRRANVTVGPAEKSTFVVDADVPPGFSLFERAGDDYCLRVLDGMAGRVALATGFVDLASFLAQARSAGRASGPVSLRLDESARGRVTLGAATFLFQFVEPPPASARPQLPLSVRDGVAGRIDWALTIIAAFSFLMHFGLVGAMYSDWADTVVDDDITVGLVHALVPESEPAPTPLAEMPSDSAPPTAAPATPVPADQGTPAAKAKAGPDGAPDARTIGGLLNDLEKMNVGIVGSLNGGPNVRGVMASGESGAPIDLEGIAKRATRIDRAGGLDLPGAGGPIALGPRGFSLPSHDTGTASTSAGRATIVVPIGDVHEEIPPLGGALPDAEAVIRKQIHPRAKRCYQTGLDADPSQSGKLVMVIKVGPSGEVESASASSNTGLSAAVVSCIAAAARRAKFGPAGPSGATVVVPFGFVKQGG